MYSVSEAYIEQMMNRGTRRRLTGKVGDVPFTGEDVVLDSFGITGKAAEESDTKIGGVFLGELELTFVPSFLNKVAREEFFGKEVEISIGLWVPDPEDEINGGDWVDVPVGVYTLQAPKISKQGISVNGYDHMKKLDKTFTIDQAYATPYAFMSYIATECGVSLGQTQQEIEALPNGTEVLPIYEDNDIETFRDFLYWLAQACGCFACADREGNIVLRPFGTDNEIELDEMHRDIDVVFSGYTTKWTGISFIDEQSDTTMYYAMDVDDGLTMNMGSNPLLQTGTAEAVERRRRAVLNAVANIQYTPFSVISARDPIFDLGDEISFTGGISGNCTGCVMAYNFTLDSFEFEGYGDDPALASAKSKSDKDISGIKKSSSENEIAYYNYANLQEINVGNNEEVVLANIYFTASKEATVKIYHEFIFDFVKDLTTDGSYELRYYYDGTLLPYKPHESLSAVNITTDIPSEEEEQTEPIVAEIDPVNITITRDFFYILKNVDPNLRHHWQVRMIARGVESAGIEVDHAHITVEGQRLYGTEYWDGYIQATDDITLIPYGLMELVSITENCFVDVADNIIESLADNVYYIDLDTMELLPAEDAINIVMEWLSLATEDGKKILTEDGKIIRIEM